MKKELKRKRLAVKRTSKASRKIWPWIVAIFVIAALALSAGLYLHKNRVSSLDTTAMTASINRLKDWVAERRGRINQKIVKVKEIALNTEQPIHFDFYAELPKMTVPVPKKEEKEAQS